MNKVQEQFDRTKRWFILFEEISQGKVHNRESDYYQDIVYAFFQNCWHLKDWIINSNSLNKAAVEDFFYGNSDLKICQALAIGTKHLTIENPNVDPSVSITKSSYSLSLGGVVPTIEVVYWIHAEGYPPLDAFSIAGSCIANCEGFLRKHNLLS